MKRPNFSHLEQIANTRRAAGLKLSAHHGVHADSLGILHLVDSDGLFDSGARYDGLLPGCSLAIGTLGEINAATLTLYNKYAESFTLTAMQYLNAEFSVSLRATISQ